MKYGFLKISLLVCTLFILSCGTSKKRETANTQIQTLNSQVDALNKQVSENQKLISELKEDGKRKLKSIEFWYDTQGILNGRADLTLFGLK